MTRDKNLIQRSGAPIDLGDGIISGAADRVVRALGPALAPLSGTIWGREE